VFGIVADGVLFDAKVYRDDGTGHPLNGVYLFTDKTGAFDLTKLPSGSGRIVESRRGVVIGEGGERHAARRHEFHERRGSEHAVRMATVHMQIGEVGRAHRTV
jgi:hypothetical protein